MPLKITLDIFSGRPNPEFILEDKAARDVLKKLSFRTLRKSGSDANPFPSVLGYRGIVIEQTEKKLSADLPTRLHYAHDTVYAGEQSARADDGLESILFDNFKSLRNVKGIPDFKKTVEQAIREFRDKRPVFIENARKWIDEIQVEIQWPPKKPVCPCAPAPDLAAWNTDPLVTSGNNCYNYGTNYRTDTFAQPGQATNHKWNDLSGCDVSSPNISAKQGALSDGLIDVPNQDNKCITPGHLVALVNAPFSDYHWYRKGPSGRWSHKPGHTPATLLDNSGNMITDPRTADRGSYVNFCTFMQVIHGRFKII